MTEPVRFSETLTLRTAPEVMALVDLAARARGSKPSEYVRQALQTALRADGFDPSSIDAAGTLTHGRAS